MADAIVLRHRSGSRWRPILLACAIAFAAAAGSPAALAESNAPAAAIAAELADRTSDEFAHFYAARGWRPLWLTASGEIRPAVWTLLRDAETAEMDGLNPRKLKARDLRRALDRGEKPTPENLARIELTASKVFAAYVIALRGGRRAAMLYETEAMAPVVPTPAGALQAAADAPSLDRHLADMGWMHPLYAPLRRALLSHDHDETERQVLATNLDRVRALPAAPTHRYVLVDAAGQRLWMYEQGRPVDSMRVVVGKADDPTPMMAGYLRYAIVNPYWNVPVDLAATRIARNVLDKGLGYLRKGRYQVLSGWGDDAAVVNPATIDWQAVATGLQQIRVRQLPGGGNFMGRVKFMFPNTRGIYLHDTPDKNLMQKDERTFSSGCVRLEDAPRLGRWLLGKPLPLKGAGAEKRIELPQPVPLYITYLTAFPEASGADQRVIAFRSDPYRRDGVVRVGSHPAPAVQTATIATIR